MPIQYTALDLTDVLQELRNRGYFFVKDSRYEVKLSRPDPNPEHRFKHTGQPRMIQLGGTTLHQTREILQQSRNPRDAADQIEAIATGKAIAPRDPNDERAFGIDAATMEAVITNRVANEVARISDAAQRKQALLEREMAELKAKLSMAAATEPKKRGRPKGSKNRPKGEPQLTEEQQAMLDALPLGNRSHPQTAV